MLAWSALRSAASADGAGVAGCLAAGTLLDGGRGGAAHLLERRPAPARLLEIIYPVGFERYFEQMAALLQTHGPDFDRIAELAAGYHLSFRLDWVEELVAVHGVTVLGQ